MREHRIFFYSCLSFVVGIFVAQVIKINAIIAFSLGLFFLFLFLVIKEEKREVWLLLFISILMFGAWRFYFSLENYNGKHIVNYSERQLELSGKVFKEVERKNLFARVYLNNLVLNNADNEKKIKGGLLVFASVYKDIKFGNEVKLSCQINLPGIIESAGAKDFNYEKYLDLQGVDAVCYRPSKISIQQEKLNVVQKIKSTLIGLRQNLKKGLEKILPIQEASLLKAMLLGYRNEITDEMRLNFSKSGVSHIMAISGMHVAIVVAMVFLLLIYMGLNRKQAFWPTVLLVFLYVVLSGFRISAVRAFVMAVAVLWAYKSFRLAKTINLLMLAGVVLLFINPKFIFYDIGFQLSFLAVLGILLFFASFMQWLKFVPYKYGIRSLVAVTLSAQILTLPLVVYYFGIISLISPVANLLIIPLVPLVLVLGMFVLLLGLINIKLAFWFGLLVWPFLKYLNLVTHYIAQIKIFSIETGKVWLGWIIIIYAFIIYIYFKYVKQK